MFLRRLAVVFFSLLAFSSFSRAQKVDLAFSAGAAFTFDAHELNNLVCFSGPYPAPFTISTNHQARCNSETGLTFALEFHCWASAPRYETSLRHSPISGSWEAPSYKTRKTKDTGTTYCPAEDSCCGSDPQSIPRWNECSRPWTLVTGLMPPFRKFLSDRSGRSCISPSKVFKIISVFTEKEL